MIDNPKIVGAGQITLKHSGQGINVIGDNTHIIRCGEHSYYLFIHIFNGTIYKLDFNVRMCQSKGYYRLIFAKKQLKNL